MKKNILKIVLCGGLLITASLGITTYADDTLTGTTAISSEVVKGDITLKIDTTTNFGQQPLSNIVDFGTKDINYTVTDYTGSIDGFTIAAKLIDKDNNRSLKINDIELSDINAPVVTQNTNNVGDNMGSVASSLKYTGVQTAKIYTSNIEWSLTKGTTYQIAE